MAVLEDVSRQGPAATGQQAKGLEVSSYQVDAELFLPNWRSDLIYITALKVTSICSMLRSQM